jgi:hypothetical protein
MTSELNTKKRPEGLSRRMCSLASLMGPAVPIGSYSIEIVIFTLYYRHNLNKSRAKSYDLLKALERVNKCRWNIVDCEYDFCHSGLCKRLNLVAEDGLVSEEHEGLRDAKGEGSEASAIATNQD